MLYCIVALRPLSIVFRQSHLPHAEQAAPKRQILAQPPEAVQEGHVAAARQRQRTRSPEGA
jgi:hypothetical protein